MTHSIVFGGSKGLGRVVARQFAARGDTVSIFSRTAPPAADLGEKVVHFPLDITDGDATREALAAAIDRHGAPSYLAFCQRHRGGGDTWAGEIEVSLTASKRIIEQLQDAFAVQEDCAVAFVGSVFSEHIGQGQDISYHLGKAGMNHMARYYAVNLGRKGIRFNTVTPFTFLKEESKDFYLNNKDVLALYEDIVPLGRMATTEDSANVVTFLCSSAASFVNGQNIYVDGGLSLVWPETLARRLKQI